MGFVVGVRFGPWVVVHTGWRFVMEKAIISILAGILTMLVGILSRADDQPGQETFVKKAIQAIGEEAKVKRVKGASWSAKGTFSFMPGQPLTFTEDWVILPPDRMYRKFELKRGKAVQKGINVFVGDKGWIKTNGETKEMTKARIEQEQIQGYLFWVRLLWPLTEKDFKVSPLGETKVEESTVTGFKISREKHAEVKLFFDKKNGLLVKCVSRAKDYRTGKDVTQEETYADYKETEGLKHPTKITVSIDGKRILEAEVSNHRYLEKVDEKLFAKP
jgi:hypothetical protein